MRRSRFARGHHSDIEQIDAHRSETAYNINYRKSNLPGHRLRPHRPPRLPPPRMQYSAAPSRGRCICFASRSMVQCRAFRKGVVVRMIFVELRHPPTHSWRPGVAVVQCAMCGCVLYIRDCHGDGTRAFNHADTVCHPLFATPGEMHNCELQCTREISFFFVFGF